MANKSLACTKEIHAATMTFIKLDIKLIQPYNAQFSDLAYLGYKNDFQIFGFFGLVGKFLTWEWAVVK